MKAAIMAAFSSVPLSIFENPFSAGLMQSTHLPEHGSMLQTSGEVGGFDSRCACQCLAAKVQMKSCPIVIEWDERWHHRVTGKSCAPPLNPSCCRSFNRFETGSSRLLADRAGVTRVT